MEQLLNPVIKQNQLNVMEVEVRQAYPDAIGVNQRDCLPATCFGHGRPYREERGDLFSFLFLDPVLKGGMLYLWPIVRPVGTPLSGHTFVPVGSSSFFGKIKPRKDEGK